MTFFNRNSSFPVFIVFLFSFIFFGSQSVYCSPSTNPPPNKTDLKDTSDLLHFSFTVYGQGTGSFISKPDDKALTFNNTTYSNFVYPGFAGVSGGGGGHFTVGWKALNLDLGYLYTQEEGKGNINGQTYTISQSASHIPLTLRLALPSTAVSPCLFGGPEWVIPNEGELKKPSYFQLIPSWVGVHNETYMAWHFGFGFDFIINEHFALPLRFKGVYAPAQRDTLNDFFTPSNDLTQPGLLVNSHWQWQAMISLGLTYRFYSYPL